MEMLHLITSFMLLICFNTVESRFNTLALFSISDCPKDFTTHCRNAAYNEARLKKTLKRTKSDSSLCTVDVGGRSCNAVSNILLDLINQDSVNFQGRCIDKNEKVVLSLNKDLLIFTYVTFDITRYISSFLSIKDVDTTLVAVTIKAMYPNAILNRPNFIFSHEASFEVEVQKTAVGQLKEDYVITYVGFLYLKESERDVETVRKSCDKRPNTAYCFYRELDKFKRRDCLKERIIDYTNDTIVNQTMYEMIEDPNLRVILMNGFGGAIHDFNYNPIVYNHTHEFGNFYFAAFEKSLTNEHNFTVLKNNELLDWEKERVIINIPGEHAINEFLKYVYFIEEHFATNELVFGALKESPKFREYEKNPLIAVLIKGWKTGDNLTYEKWLNADARIKNFVIQQLVEDRNTILQFIDYWKRANYIYKLTADRLISMKYFNPIKAIEAAPNCSLKIPTCGLGEELRHGDYKEAGWDNSYGWHCKKCSPKSYKNIPGNTDCIPCHYPLTTDDQHTTCYDPYRLNYSRLKSSLGISVIAATGASMLFIMFTMSVLIKFRDTPIVKHANRTMSILQLSSHLLLALASVFLFFGKPNKTICIIRPPIIGICFTVNISINLAKTQKLHMIFTSKTIHTQNKKNFLGMVEWVIICVLSIFDLCLSSVLYISGPVNVQYVYHNHTLIKELTCNNNLNIIVHLCFVLLLILANGVQALRSRKLPSHFKETTHVIYSSFISILVLSASATIYFLQRMATTRNHVFAIGILSLNAIHFALIYLYKLYVILFKPNWNTISAFNQRRKRKFDKNFSKVT